MSRTALPVSTSDPARPEGYNVAELLPELAVHVAPKPTVLRSSQMALQKAIKIIAMRIADVKSMLAFPLAGLP